MQRGYHMGVLVALLFILFVGVVHVQASEPYFQEYTDNPVFTHATSGFDARKISNPQVIKLENTFYLYYSGITNSNALMTGLATSNDGIHWERNPNNPIFICAENTTESCVSDSPDLSWSSFRVVPEAVLYEDGLFKMWYMGNNQNLSAVNYLGFATSEDGVEWVPYEGNPIYPNVPIVPVEYAGLVHHGDTYFLYYKDVANASYVKVATSSDGIHWSKHEDSRSVLHDIDSVHYLDGKIVARSDSFFGVSYDGFHFDFSGVDTQYGDSTYQSAMIYEDGVVHAWYVKTLSVLGSSLLYATATKEVLNSSGENTPPTIELVGDVEVVVELGEEYVDAGYVASDVEDAEGDLVIDVDSDVDIDVEGEYRVVYTVTDTGGLSASTTRKVVVSSGLGVVAFLPGITGSRLYTPPGDFVNEPRLRVWESGLAGRVWRLRFDDTAESVRKDIYTSGVVDEVRPFTGLFSYGEAYAGWLTFLENMVEGGAIAQYEVLPYDWRLAIPNVAKSGVLINSYLDTPSINYHQKGDEPYLVARLRALADASPNGKVTLVAHSMGGLLAKYLLTSLDPDDPLLDHIETVLFVGTPHLGTPKTLGELLHGSVPTTKVTSREITEDMPGPYQLLPSEAYFDVGTPPVVRFDDNVANDSTYGSLAGVEIDSATDMRRFLTGWDGAWVEPTSFALARPNVLSDYLLTYAEGLHTALDDWEAPEGVRVVNLVGWNRMTPSGIAYRTTCSGQGCLYGVKYLEHTYTLDEDGDGTVFGISGEEVKGERYYVALDKANEREGDNYSHGTLLSVPEVQQVVRRLAQGEDIKENQALTAVRPDINRYWSNAVVHSPLDVHIVGKDGTHTGITGEGSEEEMGRPYEEEVENSYYLEWGEVKYAGVIVPSEGAEYRFTGTGEGVFTLDMSVPMESGEKTKYVWEYIPVSRMSLGTMHVSVGEVPVLVYDYDGNGETDAELAPGDSFEPGQGYEVSFEGLRTAIRDVEMSRALERWFLLRVSIAERLYNKGGKRNVKASKVVLRTLAWSAKWQSARGRIDEGGGAEIVTVAQALREEL